MQFLEVVRLEGQAIAQDEAILSRDIHLLQVPYVYFVDLHVLRFFLINTYTFREDKIQWLMSDKKSCKSVLKNMVSTCYI